MNKFIFTLLISMNGLLSTAYANTDFDMTLYDSAKAGNAQSQFELATKYYELSTDEGYVKAKEWFDKSANQGYKPSQRMLGAFYYYGLTGDQNYQKAQKLLEQSIQNDNSDTDAASFHLLGIMFADGLGVRQNCNKALDFFNQSKSKMNKSLMSIGYIHLIGCAGQKDTEKAKEYFGQACDKGDQDGCDEYRKLNMLKNQ